MQKDCLISYGSNRYSVSSEYPGKDMAVVALDNLLADYYEGKQLKTLGKYKLIIIDEIGYLPISGGKPVFPAV